MTRHKRKGKAKSQNQGSGASKTAKKSQDNPSFGEIESLKVGGKEMVDGFVLWVDGTWKVLKGFFRFLMFALTTAWEGLAELWAKADEKQKKVRKKEKGK